MNASDLIVELESLGIRLWEESGRIRFRAPRGAMTEDLREAVREQRDEVLEHLRSGAPAVVAVPDPDHRHEPFPLTDVQSAYLLGRNDTYAYGGVGCHGYGELEYREDLDPDRLWAAWSRLVSRHEMLRTTVDAAGFQRVLDVVPEYHITVNDMRGNSPDEVANRIAAVRSELDHRVYQPGEWPLFGVALTRSDAGATLHVSIDFLIADFVSIQILLDDLHGLYRDPASLPPPPELTFRDYLAGERRYRSGRAYDRDREYWLARLDDLPPAPELPVVPPVTDRPARFRRYRADLSVAEWAGLRARAERAEISASTAVLAAYVEVLARWSRHPRFTVDVTLLNRLPLHPDVNRLVGDFTSVNLLAVDGGDGATLVERARALQAALWTDLDHRLFSGVEVLRELARRRGPDNALMPVVFTSAIGLGAASSEADDADHGGGSFGYGISQTPQVWIDCQNIERDGGLSSNWDVREGVLPDGLVADMVSAYRGLLRRMATDDGVWTETVPVALPDEQLGRRRRLNDTATDIPVGLLHDGVVAQALGTPERVAIVAPDRQLTYGELLSRAVAVSERLLLLGCQPGDRVAVVVDKGVRQIVGVLGVLCAGAAYVPIDTDQPPPRRDAMLSDAGARLVVTQADVGGVWPAGTLTVDLDTLPAGQEVQAPPPRRQQPGDMAYVIYTSGSTGTPKGVMISHENALNTVVDINSRFAVGDDDVVLGLAQLGFDLSVYDIFGPLAVGGRLVLPSADRRGDPSHWADLLARERVTLWNSVPAQMQMLSDHLTTAPAMDLSALRVAMLSGDWIPVTLPDQVRGQLPGLSLISLGGATEASIWSIWFPIGEVPARWRSIPYGTPLSNQTIHVLDGALRPVPDWTTGELYIGGTGVALGYIGDEERTRERFVRHPETGTRLYRTGDLGRMLPDGVVEFLGREDAQVKIRGHRVDIAEIESALRSHPAVGAGAVIVHGDPKHDRRLAAFAETARLVEDDSPLPAGLVEAASGAGEAVLRDVDLTCYLHKTRQLDHAARLAMVDALRRLGLFGSPETPHGPGEILDRVAPRHRGLVRQWLRVLVDHEVLAEDADGRYRLRSVPHAEETDRVWADVEAHWDVGGDPADLLHYFRASARHLPELLRDDQDPLRLLFPDGDVGLSDSLYRDALFNRWANAVASATVAGIARCWSRPGPLRVVEVGAGAGGTTASMTDALAPFVYSGLHVEYTLTDLSPFFLNTAGTRFEGLSWLTTAVFDLDRDPRAQGFPPNCADIVIAGDVLHATEDPDRTLDRLRELLAPGGWLVAVEMVREHHQIMTSLELLSRTREDDQDDGREQRTFLRTAEWLDRFDRAGARTEIVVPQPNEPVSELGIQVFASRFKTDRAWVDPPALLRHIGERLPRYMVPTDLQVVDFLPLTGNGKVDRNQLAGWLSSPARTVRPGDAGAASDLERRLADIWASTLRVENIHIERGLIDQGGDSLLAAQLAGRLLEQVPEAAHLFFDQLLRILLGNPSVRKLANDLAAPVAAAAATATSAPGLLRLGGSDGTERVVVVHDATGTLTALGDLVQALVSRDARVLGLVVADGEDYLAQDPELCVERIADRHARAVLAEPAAPLRLVGVGFGGLVACEVARQVAEAGGSVAGLTIVDADPAGDVNDTEGAEEVVRIYRHSLLAQDSYEPALYAGDITLVVPEATVAGRARDDVTRRWEDACLGELTVVEVPGDEITCVSAELASHVADAVLRSSADVGAE